MDTGGQSKTFVTKSLVDCNLFFIVFLIRWQRKDQYVFCGKCGYQAIDVDNFCTVCGKPLRKNLGAILDRIGFREAELNESRETELIESSETELIESSETELIESSETELIESSETELNESRSVKDPVQLHSVATPPVSDFEKNMQKINDSKSKKPDSKKISIRIHS